MAAPWPRVEITALAKMTREERDAISSSTAPLLNSAQCSHCGQMAYQLNRKLKRCGGCSVTMYCSRECQKQGWSRHKDFCRRVDDPERPRTDGHTFSGYPSAIILANAIKFWVEIHDYGFTVVTSATVLLSGAIPTPADIASRSPPAFRFMLDVGAKSEGIDGNPAKAFQLLDASLVREEDLGPLSDSHSWDNMVEHCRLAAEAKRRESPMHILAGMLPAVFIMVNTGLTTWHHFPVYLPQRRNAYALDESSRALIGDAQRMCLDAMNAGDIFRNPTAPKPTRTPDLGTLIKRKKKWWWEGRDEHAYWDGLSRRVARGGESYKSGLLPVEIWERFQRL